ncbi:MAG: histidine kinase N-terminal 7TM domain-containing protein, partial [Candidatus Thermoplasmatota archaeon]
YNLNLLFYYLKYVAILYIPFLLFYFVSFYTGRTELIKNKIKYVLVAIPYINILFVFTNNYHFLFWSKINVFRSNQFMAVYGDPGPIYIFSVLYTYSLITISIFLIFEMLINQRRVYLKESIFLLIAILTPFFANIIGLFDIFLLIPGIDETPFLLIITGISFTLIIFKGSFLRLQPFAVSKILDNIKESIIILNEKYEIIDYNENGKKILSKFFNPYQKDEFAEVNFKELMSNAGYDLNKIKYNKKNNSLLKLEKADTRKYFEMDFNPIIEEQNDFLGSIIILHDVTSQKKTEKKLKQKIDDLEKFKKNVVEREIKMIELKNEINDLRQKQTGG